MTSAIAAPDVEEATTSLSVQPDAKTKRYDRQLRLWAASGQSALESANVLVIGVTATSTASLKNLVLPGVGSVTILDDGKVTGADVGNNFFLEYEGIGKSRAEEAVRLLLEMNDGVKGTAVQESLDSVLQTKKDWLLSFTLIIAHNVDPSQVQTLSEICWSEEDGPTLLVAQTAGFLAEFFLQYKEHTISDPHSETFPSLRIDKPFPSLLEKATSLDFDKMDVTDHSHIPYLLILVRVLHDWRAAHDGSSPKTYAEKQEFKKLIGSMRRKIDEENFEEAENNSYRCWSETKVGSDITGLYSLIPPSTTKPFYFLLKALKAFTDKTGLLPLSPTLPDMHTSTDVYIELQKIYRAQAEIEKQQFLSILTEQSGPDAVEKIGLESIETFLKNSHALRILNGQQYGSFDNDAARLKSSLEATPKETALHIGFAALKRDSASPSVQSLRAIAQKLVGDAILPDEFDEVSGELERAPTADLPNTAALMGGLIAQEAIKAITKQYVPINGYCVIDLIGSWTGVVGGL